MNEHETKPGILPRSQDADDARDAMLAVLQQRTGLSHDELLRAAVRFSFARQNEFVKSLRGDRDRRGVPRVWRRDLPAWLDVNVFLAVMFCLGIALSLIVLLAQR